MATVTVSGSGRAEFADGGADWTVTTSGDLDARIWVAETRLPETPYPWFQITLHGVMYQGQAVSPPKPDGAWMCFRLTLSPLPPNG
jgi:hypothetical protein